MKERQVDEYEKWVFLICFTATIIIILALWVAIIVISKS